MEKNMSNVYYTNVLDDPYYIGNGTFLSVVTNGKVRVEGETDRDYNKDAGAKAGLLKINTDNETVKFIDFSEQSEDGDRYRAVAVVGKYAYVMRTQKKHVDSIVRMAKVDLDTDTVEMIQDKAITIHGVETPKTFCGHFNFGRPVVVGKKIIYPPLNSGVVIIYDTESEKMIARDVADETASVHCTYIEKTNEVAFFPYGNPTDQLLVLSLDDYSTKLVTAPVKGAFYGAISRNDKIVGLPLVMGETKELHFWIYDGNEITSVPYVLEDSESEVGQLGFKNGVIVDNRLIAHSSWEKCQELIDLNLDTLEIKRTRTDRSLGSMPVVGDSIMLMPSVQHPSMSNIAPGAVFDVNESGVTESFNLKTNNIYVGVASKETNKAVTVPFRFDLVDNVLKSEMLFVDLKNKESKQIAFELEME